MCLICQSKKPSKRVDLSGLSFGAESFPCKKSYSKNLLGGLHAPCAKIMEC